MSRRGALGAKHRERGSDVARMAAMGALLRGEIEGAPITCDARSRGAEGYRCCCARPPGHAGPHVSARGSVWA